MITGECNDIKCPQSITKYDTSSSGDDVKKDDGELFERSEEITYVVQSDNSRTDKTTLQGRCRYDTVGFLHLNEVEKRDNVRVFAVTSIDNTASLFPSIQWAKEAHGVMGLNMFPQSFEDEAFNFFLEM